MEKIKDFAACVHTLLYLKTCSFRHLNKNGDILYSTLCHLNLCIKQWGSPSSFRRKRPVNVISLNCSDFIENYQVPKVHGLVRALITQKMMRRKDAQCS